MIVIHNNCYLRCMVSDIKMFYCQPDMTSSSVLRQEKLHTLFNDGFLKIDHDFQLMIHCNFIATMHSFRDKEVLLQAGYDVIMISPMALQAIFHDGYWKSEHDFLIVINSNFLSAMHGFRDNEVFIVIIISIRGRFRWCFMTYSERATMTYW